MNFSVSWILGLFRKPQVEVTLSPEGTAWPFPVSTEKPKAKRKPAAKKTVAKKATKVVKKATK
jgi:hypothetical protein